MRRERGAGATRRLVVACAAVAVTVLATPATAWSHTFFEGSDPADGAALVSSPRRVTLEFSQAVSVPLTKVHLVDGGGQEHAVGPVSGDPTSAARIVVALPDLRADAYRLSFLTRDDLDFHATSGSIVFAIGGASPLVGRRPSVAGPALVDVALRWLVLGGLALLVGGLLMALGVVPRALAGGMGLPRARRRALGQAALGAALVVAAQSAMLLRETALVGPLLAGAGRVLSRTRFGARWQVATALAVAAAVVLSMMRRAERPSVGRARTPGSGSRRLAVVACAITLAEVAALSATSHARSNGPTGFATTIARGAHLLGATAWAGGLVALVGALWAVRGAGLAAAEARTALLRAFAPVATAALTLLVVTGLVLAGVQVASLTALLSTRYGATLLAKLVVIAAALGLAIRHHGLAGRPSQRRPARRIGPVHRSVLLEAGAVFAVLALAAALAATAPARGPEFTSRATAESPSTITAGAGDLVLRLSLKPNRPGRSLLAVDVLNTRRPAPPILGVRVVVHGRASRSTTSLAATGGPDGGRFELGALDLTAGRLDVAVSVERPGGRDVDLEVPWRVNAPAVTLHRPIISSRPLAPAADGAAAALAALAGVGALLARRRRSRPPVADHGPGIGAPFVECRAAGLDVAGERAQAPAATRT